MIAGKRKLGGHGAICSAKFKFFHPSAPLMKKTGNAAMNKVCLNGVTIARDLCAFSCCSCTKYDG